MRQLLLVLLLLSNFTVAETIYNNNPQYPQVSITGGVYRLSVNNVAQPTYYTQLYTAEAAAINIAAMCSCPVVIKTADRTVTATWVANPQYVAPPPIIKEVIKEVPVLKEVIVEVIKEVKVEVIKEVQVIKEVIVPNKIRFSWAPPTQRENGTALALNEIGGYDAIIQKDGVTISSLSLSAATQEYTYDLPTKGSYVVRLAVHDTNRLYSNFLTSIPYSWM